MRLSRQAQAAIAVALARTLFCAYRAATQSYTHDEAYSYLTFIDAPWANFWERFDANNHILYTILARGAAATGGAGEFALRLPSVLAGLAMTLGIWRLLQHVEWAALRWTMYAALALHPLLLDFSVAARGYGMSLAFLVWAVHVASRRRWSLTGYLLGFGIAANFTLAFPALALLGAVFLLERGIERLRAPVLIGAPALWIVAILCARPLQAATRSHFYLGLQDLGESVRNLMAVSVLALGAQREGPIAALTWVAWSPYIFGAASVFLLALARYSVHKLAPLTLGIAAAGIVLARYWLDIAWPIDRTGLYVMVLAGVSWALVTEKAPWRWLRWTGLAAAAILAVQFASQLQARTIEVWWFNASSKDAMRALADEVADRAPASVRVAASIAQHPVLEYYRRRWNVRALAPLERQDPDPSLTGYDYYVLSPPGPVYENAKRLRVVYTEPLSRVVAVK